MTHTIYLAGPTVFFPDATTSYAQLSELCRARGFDPIVPAEVSFPNLSGKELATAIREANIESIRRCDAVLADIRPFRGHIEPDSGTVFEIGFATALGKPVALYGAVHDWGARICHEGCIHREDGDFDITFNMKVEDFGERTNLMLAGATYTGSDVESALDALVDALRPGPRPS